MKRGTNLQATWWAYQVAPKGRTNIVFPHLYTLQARILKSMNITNSKKHALDGRTYHKISIKFPIRDRVGSTISETSRFLITVEGGLNQNWSQYFGVFMFQVQRKGWHSRKADIPNKYQISQVELNSKLHGFTPDFDSPTSHFRRQLPKSHEIILSHIFNQLHTHKISKEV